MSASPPQVLSRFLLRATTTASRRRLATTAPSSSLSSGRYIMKVSPAAENDISHLLENEHEYGIAKPMCMDAFQKEQYHQNLLHGSSTTSSSILAMKNQSAAVPPANYTRSW